MGKAARSKAVVRQRGARQPGTARSKLAERRQAERRAHVRRRLLLAGGSVALVIALVAALVAVKLTGSSVPPRAARPDARVAADLARVPQAAFDAVGTGTATGLKVISGEPELISGGKPEVLYMGGEYCPYCAAERWALAVALSRFGTLSGLSFIHSAPDDGNVPTLTFYKSAYTSKYLSFTPVEWFGEAADPSTPFGHVYLQRPTSQEAALFQRYAGEAIPFVDIGNRYVVPQVQYQFSDLQGLTWDQIAADVRDPSNQVAKDIDGAANVLTAAMCTLTHGQPASVCTSAGVKAAAGSL